LIDIVMEGTFISEYRQNFLVQQLKK